MRSDLVAKVVFTVYNSTIICYSVCSEGESCGREGLHELLSIFKSAQSTELPSRTVLLDTRFRFFTTNYFLTLYSYFIIAH